MRYEEYIKVLTEEYTARGIVDGSRFPNIDLYIDQLVTCLNDELSLYGDEQRPPITKSMVSNYAKRKMIPRPKGRQYTKDHLIFMTIVFYLKSCFSMEEIQRLMHPLLENYESPWDEPIDLLSIYNRIVDDVQAIEADLPDRLEAHIRDVKHFLSDREAGDDDTSELMMLITTLILRSNAERFIAGKLLDEYFVSLKKGAKKK